MCIHYIYYYYTAAENILYCNNVMYIYVHGKYASTFVRFDDDFAARTKTNVAAFRYRNLGVVVVYNIVLNTGGEET